MWVMVFSSWLSQQGASRCSCWMVWAPSARSVHQRAVSPQEKKVPARASASGSLPQTSLEASRHRGFSDKVSQPSPANVYHLPKFTWLKYLWELHHHHTAQDNSTFSFCFSLYLAPSLLSFACCLLSAHTPRAVVVVQLCCLPDFSTAVFSETWVWILKMSWKGTKHHQFIYS